MVPKIIHYCWFGGNPLPPHALECIASWKKFLPEYEIWQWGESTSPTPSEVREMIVDKVMAFDVNSIPYTAEAYRQKKYAFVSDYCRFVAMYEYGGIYFDTDVEVIRPMDKIIAKGNFMGFEVDPDGENTPGKYAPRYCLAVNPGVGFGMTAKHPFMKKMVDYYQELRFVPADPNRYNKGLFEFLNPFKKKEKREYFKTIVAYTTELLCDEGLKNQKGIQTIGDITIYPREYFAPIDVITGRLKKTRNTYTIHRYMGSWTGKNEKKSLKKYVQAFLPDFVFYSLNKIRRLNYKL